MDTLILGVDPGNHKGKVVGPFGVDSYKSNICDWFERDVEESFGKDDMEFHIGSRKGYAGSIAEHEDDYGSGMYGDSKAHEDTKIRVLLAIYRYLKRYCPHYEKIAIVTGQPIISHKHSEMNIITDMLEGYHEFIVNKQKVAFTIMRVGVVPEGSAAFWSNPVSGEKIRILDCGSATINAATITDNHHVNTASGTFNFGMETVKDKNDLKGIARGIVRNTTKLKWKQNDTVYICGGVAAGIEPFIREHYSNAKLLEPCLKRGDSLITLDPVYANAAGYYVMAKGAFG